MKTWIELEDGFLTNQSRFQPNVEPTEAWLLVHRCKQTKRAVVRKRDVHHVKAINEAELDELIGEFAERPDVVLLPAKERT